MRARVPAIAATGLVLLGAVSPTRPIRAAQPRGVVERIEWNDVAPIASRLEAHGISASTFASHVARLRQSNAERAREGDLDHLVYYLLQSTRFTTQPAIEPALSAKALVEGLEPGAREAFLKGALATPPPTPDNVRSRISALVKALGSVKESSGSNDDPRLVYFRGLVEKAFPERRQRESSIAREYLRVMRFVYEKEFVAQRADDRAGAVAALYRSRGLSTDTALEAGFLVHLGIGVIKALEPERRVRRVLIVGPGLDLAPRTSLVEDGPPESYQPWAVIDALVSVGLSRIVDLEVVAADINPRVVEHLRRARTRPPTLTLVSEIRESETVTLSDEYRDYFTQLGRATATPAGGPTTNGPPRKIVNVSAGAARVLHAEILDVVTERLGGPHFDLVVATNVLPYFDDASLVLALTNIAGMLAPGGVFLHNESRPLVREVTAALGLPFEQSRHAIIASVRGAPAPLYDSVFLHRRRQ